MAEPASSVLPGTLAALLKPPPPPSPAALPPQPPANSTIGGEPEAEGQRAEEDAEGDARHVAERRAARAAAAAAAAVAAAEEAVVEIAAEMARQRDVEEKTEKAQATLQSANKEAGGSEAVAMGRIKHNSAVSKELLLQPALTLMDGLVGLLTWRQPVYSAPAFALLQWCACLPATALHRTSPALAASMLAAAQRCALCHFDATPSR